MNERQSRTNRRGAQEAKSHIGHQGPSTRAPLLLSSRCNCYATMAAVKKLDVHSASSDYSKTYVFHEEDHTVGNALRHVLMRNPDVDFCGYTIPHPSEPKMHIRLQTRPGVPSDDTLRAGITDLRKVSSSIADAYRKELKAFNRRQKKN